MQELNRLELEFLYLIQFQLHITLKDLQEYADQLLTMSTVTRTSCTVEHRTKTLPLTPPYHPYKIPPKKKLGLISPND